MKAESERRVGPVVQLHGALPCVLSLGEHPPTESRCQTWAGIRIDDGPFRHDRSFRRIKVGLMMDLPGIMSRGNWTAALFVGRPCFGICREGADQDFHRRVGGTTHLLSILVGQSSEYVRCRSPARRRGDTRIVRIRRLRRRRDHADPR